MNRFLLLLFAVSISVMLNAQNNDRAEKRKAIKVGYITEKLNLTSDEAAKFWPIFNEFESEREALRKDRPAVADHTNITDKEADTVIKFAIESKEKEVALLKRYVDRFKTAIPPQKIAKLLMIENEFKQDVADAVKTRSENKRMMRRN